MSARCSASYLQVREIYWSSAPDYACPLDLFRDLAARGAKLVCTDAVERWGGVGRFVPTELRGSTVAVWRFD